MAASPDPTKPHAAAPAWRRVTEGETRWPATVALAVAIVLQLLLPSKLSPGPRWVVAVMELVVLTALLIVNPDRLSRRSSQLRIGSIFLIAVLSFANALSAVLLIRNLVDLSITNAGELLRSGAAVWATNVIVFALWYWEADRGGPAARARSTDQYPDLLFPQMATPEVCPPDWEPNFVDYLYTSFTNATAFSPTDVMPLARWAKLAFLVQAGVSLAIVGLVIARAVNILQ